MENVINYYYSLYPDNIHQNEKGYYFKINETRYFFTKYTGDVKDIQRIYDMHINLLNKNFYIHPIVLNNQNQILTYINNEPYILMVTVYYKNKININDILYFSKVADNSSARALDWGLLWSQKNDYLEYQISMLGRKHPLIRESFSYYIGLGETAIQLVNSLEKTNVPLIYSHKRISMNDRQYDLYNPLNLTVDFQVRDMAEYLKSRFFSGEDITEDLTYYLNNAHLSTYEYFLFLARLIYPTYYFDLYEEIITDRRPDEDIKKIINRANDFELIIKRVYLYYKVFLPMPKIDWLET